MTSIPSWVCKERTTKSQGKRLVALRVAQLFGSGFVAPQSSRMGGTPSSRLARAKNPRNNSERINHSGHWSRTTDHNSSMRLGINTFLFVSPFKTESVKLFPKFKRWGFQTVEIPVEDPSHIDPVLVKTALDKNGLACGSVCACMGPLMAARKAPLGDKAMCTSDGKFVKLNSLSSLH